MEFKMQPSGRRSPYYGMLGTDTMPSQVRTIWYTKDEELEPDEGYKLCDREWEDFQSVEKRIDNRSVILCLLDRLTEKEQDIMVMRFVDEMTLEEVGKEYGVTRERIRQIENKAIRKMIYWTRENKRFEKAMREYRERMIERSQ